MQEGYLLGYKTLFQVYEIEGEMKKSVHQIVYEPRRRENPEPAPDRFAVRQLHVVIISSKLQLHSGVLARLDEPVAFIRIGKSVGTRIEVLRASALRKRRSSLVHRML